MSKIIFTDLDGTLLDHENYSYDAVKPTLKKLKKEDIPVVICTSKTRAEIEVFRKEIDNYHPFLSENGGGVFIPKDYFDFDFKYDKEDENYFIVVLGASLGKLVETLDLIKKHYEIDSFLDMTAEEISADSNLDVKRARLAKKREFDIPFKIKNYNSEDKIFKIIRENNLSYSKGGRYYHLMGNNNKGDAIDFLTKLYKKKYDEVFTIGIGDSNNDFSMLNSVDRGYLVMKKDETYASSDFNPAGEIGPKGWSRVVEKELDVL